MNRHCVAIAAKWAAAVLLSLTIGLAPAQDAYPSKPIRILVPFTPATGADILARTLGPRLGDDWKVAVVVENRPGASGNIGTEAVAKSPPDGYTLLTTASTIVLNNSMAR